MKKLLLIGILILYFKTENFAQQQTVANNEVVFEKDTLDFSKTTLDKPVNIRFRFINNSHEPLRVESAGASCGCSKPSWIQDAVFPGKIGWVNVVFQPDDLGVRSKQVWVKFSGLAQVKELMFKGKVIPAGSENGDFSKDIPSAKGAN